MGRRIPNTKEIPFVENDDETHNISHKRKAFACGAKYITIVVIKATERPELDTMFEWSSGNSSSGRKANKL